MTAVRALVNARLHRLGVCGLVWLREELNGADRGRLRMGDLESCAGGGGDRPQVAFVGAEYDVTAAQDALDNAGVHDACGRGAGS